MTYFLSGIIALVGCDVHEYIPSKEELLLATSPTAAFTIDANEVCGVYGNMDVDSVILCYRTGLDQSEFWKSLLASVSSQNWKCVSDDTSVKHFVRVATDHINGAARSVEEVRVAYLPTKKVVVAWLQADLTRLANSIPSTEPEGEFAKNVLWPKFNDCLEQANW